MFNRPLAGINELKKTKPIFMVFMWVSLSITLILFVFGFFAVFKAKPATSIVDFFGAEINSTNIGLVVIFLAIVFFFLIMNKLIKELSKIVRS